MNTIPLRSDAHQLSKWRKLYLAALFETDRSRLPIRISHAERALIERERELFTAESGPEEKTAVNNALHALQALRMCIELAA
jgi:hypothetical protein